MKILYFVENYLAPSETFILDQLKYFNKCCTIKILTTKILPHSKNSDFDVEVVPYFGKSSLLRKVFLNKYSYLSLYEKNFSKKISNLIHQFKPDIIHCHFGIQSLVLIDNFINSNKTPILITFHGYDATSFIKKYPGYRLKLKSLFLKKHIFPLFVCQYHKELLENYSITSLRSKIIYNGVDVSIFELSEKKKGEETIKFTQISRFVEKKGLYYTIKAFELFKIAHPKVHFNLTLIGDGELKNQIELQVQNSIIRDNVIFLGWQNQKQIIECLKNTNIYVQHSITSKDFNQEATSVTILEAMSMGIPILSTLHAGIPEVVNKKEFGILVCEKNIEQYAKAIHVISEYGISIESRNYIKCNHNLKTQNKKIFNHYNAIISK